MRNRRIVVTKTGGPEVLRLVEEDRPEPQAGEARVKVIAAGVSAYDVMVRSSRLLPPKPPFTPGVDIVGVVDKLGDGVSRIGPGQRVAALLGFGNGGYAEYVCAPADELVPVPPELDPAEAVCLVANYLTAHRVMYETAKLLEGERILVHGASGGVGSAILDLGRLANLRMIGTASPRNQDLVFSLGATPIDYRSEKIVKRVRDLTGDGADAAFDQIGGFRQLLRSYRALRKGGRLVWFGVAATKYAGIKVIPLSIATMLLLSIVPDGRRALFASDDSEHTRRVLPELFELLGQGKLKPLVADRIPLAEARDAHERIERGGYAGKFVLIPNDG